jgi:hypothetical protein
MKMNLKLNGIIDRLNRQIQYFDGLDLKCFDLSDTPSPEETREAIHQNDRWIDASNQIERLWNELAEFGDQSDENDLKELSRLTLECQSRWIRMNQVYEASRRSEKNELLEQYQKFASELNTVKVRVANHYGISHVG